MEQLTFELAPIEPPSFANFLAGPNAEAVTALRHLARGEVRETGRASCRERVSSVV